MKLVAISRVKDEADIIEPFVRHHADIFDIHLVLDDGSSDGTWEMLQELKREGLPLVLMREPSVGYRQSQYMTGLMRRAAAEFGADWIVPLDADEFLETPEAISLATLLEHRERRIFTIPWNNFVWSAAQDQHLEPNPVLRMRLRMPASPASLNKVVIPTSWPAEQLELTQGSHAVLHNGRPLPTEILDEVRLCHFPIRSKAQFAGKVAIGYLQYAAMSDWDRHDGFHYIESFRLLKQQPEQFYRNLPDQSRRYSLYPTDPDPGHPVDGPLRYRGGDLLHVFEQRSGLSIALDHAEAVATRLAAVSRQLETLQRAAEAAGFAHDSSTSPEGGMSCERSPSAQAKLSAVTRTTFQSFWAGGPLSPYELLCLNSFIKCGHAFDLYSFDPELAVPAGVQLRDARELVDTQDFFVYEDGFGKGSPAGFANLFRYKLLAEKGGWWVDTDVVCQARNVPRFKEFFAREDGVFINNAVLFFEAGHPLMVRCLEEAAGLGRAVRWGDSGPRLLTRILKEQARDGDALDGSICYPVHYSDALDLLAPSRLASVRERAASSLFIHLWNAMLDHHGIDKTMLPPKGSALRHWAEQNSMAAWAGEYDAGTIEALWLADAEQRRSMPNAGAAS
jgi:glycosyltransferase involved in cell wall biosynthesis